VAGAPASAEQAGEKPAEEPPPPPSETAT